MPSVNRRQFVRKSLTNIAAAGAAVAGVNMIRPAGACPVVYDANGNQVQYVCRIAFEPLLPDLWLYTWENCASGQMTEMWCQPNLSLGDCAFAAQDPGCVDANGFLGLYTEMEVDGESFNVSKKLGIDKINEIRSYLRRRPRTEKPNKHNDR